MMIIIANDDGEVYTRATNVHLDTRGRWVASDDEGDETLLTTLVEGAQHWEEANR